VKILGKKRVTQPSLSLLDELDEVKRTTLGDISTILVIGALSLIAGASLGPEASLVAASMGVAAWISGKFDILKQPTAFVLSISSLGALLAAFFNSLLPILIPILLLKKKGKLNLINLLIVIFSGVASWAVVHIIKGEAYISVPVSGTLSMENLALAGLLGFLSALLAVIVKQVIYLFFPFVEKINNRSPWVISAMIFSTILGFLYLVGGQTVEFSGSEGLKLLSENPAQYGATALLGLIVVKLVATSWSTTTGYRGGLVFPSIYMGVTMSLAFSTVFGLSGLTEAGVTIGAVTGILLGMTSPILGIVLVFALFPASLSVVVVGGVIGSIAGIKAFSSLLPVTEKS
jgi:H+/Cl- antiporter ClcA